MKIDELLKKMTLKEKIALCSGKNEWCTKAFPKYNIPSVMMSDGPHGIRKQNGEGDMLGIGASEKATCFPTASISACSFDQKLIAKMASAIAQESGSKQVGMFLGPGVNIKRNPLCGRNFEYFSEDPYLAGKLGAAYITAAQKKGIGTSLKHFACNNQEYFRMVSDSLVDERTLHELYLLPFEIAVREGKPATVMCAYNRINGTFCSENKWLLTDILRKEWNFRGVVVTDWNAVGDRSIGFESGCDLAMPGGSGYGEADAASNVKKGLLDEKKIDESAKRILKMVFSQKEALMGKFEFSVEKHHELALQAAQESAVLLKNERNMLPFKDTTGMVLLGDMAEHYRFQGHGSSRVNPTRTESIKDQLMGIPYAKGYDKEGGTTKALLEEAVNLAKNAEKAVIVAGLPERCESEGFDREHMKMPEGHNKLIEAVAKVNPNVVVLLCCGSPVEVPWSDKVKAILYMGLAGQAGARAAVNLLMGRANPCGRLAETWPLVYEDCPNAGYYINGRRDAEYREGIYIGYRYYDKAGKKVRFAFGEGLSYTAFSYKDLQVLKKKTEQGKSSYEVSVTVTNTGSMTGKEAVLLFVCPPQNGIYRPLKELKAFKKIELGAGESRKVHFELDDRAFAIWQNGWLVPNGGYRIGIGGHKGELILEQEIEIDDKTKVQIYNEDHSWYQHLSGRPSREDWLSLMGRDVEEKRIKPYTVNSVVSDVMIDSRFIRLIYNIFESQQRRQFGKDSIEYKNMMKMAGESSLRCIQSSLYLKGHFAQGLADLANGKWLKAIWHMIH